MKHLKMTAAVLALTAGSAFAQSTMDSETPAMPEGGDAAENSAPLTTPQAQNEDTADTLDEATEDDGSDMAQDNAAEPMAPAAPMGGAPADTAMDSTATPMDDGGPVVAGLEGEFMLSSDITGNNVYAIDADGDQGVEWDDAMSYDAVDENWDDVGDISDVVLNADGSLQGVVADIGGFLGIGESQVFVPLEEMKMVPMEDGRFAVVTNYTQEELEGRSEAGDSALN